MNFKKNNYIIIKQAISKELCYFLTDYLLLKRKVAERVINKGVIVPGFPLFGNFGDGQIPGSYNHYADIAMEILLKNLKQKIEKTTKVKLIETYSYMRIYRKGDELKRHKDRESCEISTTLNLGGDSWPIFIDGSGKKNNKGTKVNLLPGDMLIYRGCELEHWREVFEGDECVQVFLHYNEKNGKFNNLYDGRDFLGLPCKDLNA
jgi:hypothetical protein